VRSPKTVVFNGSAQEGLGRGIALAGRLAAVTYGPDGGTVALERQSDTPLVTKSGFAAIRDVTLSDGFDRIGLEMVKEAVTRVRYATGDGAATVSILAAALSQAASRLTAAGIDPGTIARGFVAARGVTVDSLGSMRRDLPNTGVLVRLCAAAGDGDTELAAIVADAVQRVGADGIVHVSFNQSVDTRADYATGMAFEHGVQSRDFLDAEGELRLESPLLLLCEDALEDAADVIPALEIAHAEKRPLLVLAEAVTKQALAALIANHRGGTVRCAAVKGPGSGAYRHEMTADVAVLAGGFVLGARLGRRPAEARRDDLGGVDLAILSGRNTRLSGGEGSADAVAIRVHQLRDAHAQEAKTYDRGKLAQRIARLTAGTANVRVGAFTETEWKERHRRCETMVSVARSALSGGVVAGGGLALYRAGEAVRRAAGADPVAAAFAKAIGEPFAQITRRSGRHPSSVAAAIDVVGSGAGYDARSGSVVADAAGEALVDALPIVVAALNAAVSTAEQVARVGCVVAAGPRRARNKRMARQ
jgi:chaperonin GroEL